MTQLLISAYNYESGGHNKLTDTFDVEPLKQAFAVLDTPPALILFCESKLYRRRQYQGLRLAERAFTEQFDAPYFGLLGTMTRGPMPPAIFYNTNLLTCLHWPSDDPHEQVFDGQRNLGLFRVNETGRQFGAWVDHFDPWHGCDRLRAAKLRGQYGRDSLPFIGGGDLNCSASGPHFPQRDWAAAHPAFRRYKGIHNGFDTDTGTLRGPVRPATAPMDFLIGAWDHTTGRRTEGAGYHAIAELAWQHNSSKPIQSSVIDKPHEGGTELIDYLLANTAMLPHVDPASYRVHIPDPGLPDPSDHYLITVVVNL
ncbi:hypothetical protein AB0M54_14285 [Actinoplanes sp. NPDC051470]|uniref:hypothetical protein n=1 Tax=Actinoplanes sp. NPDC051470 TaxID=3157224 RepID=UPI00341CC823